MGIIKDKYLKSTEVRKFIRNSDFGFNLMRIAELEKDKFNIFDYYFNFTELKW